MNSTGLRHCQGAFTYLLGSETLRNLGPNNCNAAEKGREKAKPQVGYHPTPGHLAVSAGAVVSASLPFCCSFLLFLSLPLLLS
jgi:hypothetical protein